MPRCLELYCRPHWGPYGAAQLVDAKTNTDSAFPVLVQVVSQLWNLSSSSSSLSRNFIAKQVLKQNLRAALLFTSLLRRSVLFDFDNLTWIWFTYRIKTFKPHHVRSMPIYCLQYYTQSAEDTLCCFCMQYGYRLPETDEDIFYVQVYFRTLSNAIFTYPSR